MIIAVDFDGTIVEHDYPAIGKEKPFAIETLKKLMMDGHKLILWTSREGALLDEAVSFCSRRGIKFYAVNSDRPETSLSFPSSAGRKIPADVYIDDHNVGGLPEWGEIYQWVSDERREYKVQFKQDHHRHHHHHHRHGFLWHMFHGKHK